MTADKEQVIKTAQKFELNVEFVDKVPGRNPNASGAYDSKTKTVYINQNTKYPIHQVFLHELTHFFESADGYSQFENTVMNSKAFEAWVKRETEIKSQAYDSVADYRKALKERYGEKDDTKINREIVAFFVSDNLFQKDFGKLGELAKEIGNNERKGFIAFIKKIFARLKTAVSGLDKLEKKFLNLSRSAVQNKNTDSNNGVKYMYTGEKSQTADKLKLETAKEMEKQGVDSETIRKETGWFKGYDNKWRFEIDDSKMHLTDKPIGIFGTKLGELIIHDELFSAYPQLRNVDVCAYDSDTYNGSADFYRNTIWMNNDILIDIKDEKKRSLIFESKEYKEYSNKLSNLIDEMKKVTKPISEKMFEAASNNDLETASKLNNEYKKVSEQYDAEIDRLEEEWANSEKGKLAAELNDNHYGMQLNDSSKTTLIHEKQHFVQCYESFAKGSTADWWGKKILDDAIKEKSRIKDKLLKQSNSIIKDIIYMYDERIERMSYKGDISASDFAKAYDTAVREISDDNIKELFFDYAESTEKYYETKKNISTKSHIAYRNTAGEIEARDVSNRLNLNNEQRKNTRPDIDRTDVVFSDSDRSYKINDYQFNESKLKNNAEQVLKMNSVCDLVGDEFNGPLSTLNERIDNYFKKICSVKSKDFGDVQLTKTSRRSDVRHGRTKYKISSYAAIPNVIEKGTPVFVIFKNNVERVVIAAPITISSQKYYMGVMLQRDSQSQRLYLHDVVIEKEIEISTEEHLNTEQGRPRNDNLSMTSILKKALNVNTNSRMIFENSQNDTDIQQMYTGEEANS